MVNMVNVIVVFRNGECRRLFFVADWYLCSLNRFFFILFVFLS